MESMNELAGYMSSSTEENVNEIPSIQTAKFPVSFSNSNPVSSSKDMAAKTAAVKPVDTKRYKYIPMRLNEDERRLLNVLENALEVCEYTDVVDVTFSHLRKSKLARIYDSLVDVMSISSGLLVKFPSFSFLSYLVNFSP
jgi:hypothetical protein